MKKMNVNEMQNTNAGAKCPYCNKNKKWYELWLHKSLCGQIFNLTGGQRKNRK